MIEKTPASPLPGGMHHHNNTKKCSSNLHKPLQAFLEPQCTSSYILTYCGSFRESGPLWDETIPGFSPSIGLGRFCTECSFFMISLGQCPQQPCHLACCIQHSHQKLKQTKHLPPPNKQLLSQETGITLPCFHVCQC